MRRARYVVLDTCVLQKANATLGTETPPKERRQISGRLRILQQMSSRTVSALGSAKLLAEYARQVPEPRNEFVAAFLSLMTGGAVEMNWGKLTGADREDLRRCKYPPEDTHVLQTGKGKRSTIVTEEGRLLAVDACTHRCFGVHISEPAAFRP